MIILGIETSCDETALSIIEASGNINDGIHVRVLADKTLSQIELHKEYGGVFPSLAKREHSKNLIPLLKTVLEEARKDSGFKSKDLGKITENTSLESYNVQLKSILEKEAEMLQPFLEFIPTIEKPPLDAIAVTQGPGLEPCLWTGINLAKALSLVWDIPIVPINHMEGHIFSALLHRKEISNSQSSEKKAISYKLSAISYPSLALLISGGHTELVLVKDWFEYELLGQTRDDAVGEAFDKVARILGLPYPGGPEISRLAETARSELLTSQHKNGPTDITLPRPMIHSDNLDFSFSGLKTAVLYLVRSLPSPLLEDTKRAIAKEFEDAVTDVLVAKTKKALQQYGVSSLLVGGGVIANTNIRRSLAELANTYDRMYFLNSTFLHVPEPELTTDNALMIAVAGFLRFSAKGSLTEAQNEHLLSRGNLKLDGI